MDTSLVNTVFLTAGSIYFVIHLGLVLGVYRCQYRKSSIQPFVTILVAARNEEQTIRSLLDCLVQQTYPHYEIIIINDRSTDKTSEYISQFRKNYSCITQVNITSVSSDMPSKKNALQAGIAKSNGTILCFTDADCFPPPQWLESLIGHFTSDVGLVAGYSPYQIPFPPSGPFSFFKKIFFRFIAYEEFRAALWASGSIGWNAGWLCTGRNLAYRKEVFHQVGGFEKIKHSISGDDDLFLQLVRDRTEWKIRFVVEESNFVPTVPPPTVQRFIEQRKRHFSAAAYFPFSRKLFFSVYHFINFLFILSVFLFCLNWIYFSSMLSFLLLKFISDMILILPSIRLFHTSSFRRSFFFMEIIYIFYNSLIGPLGLLKKFTWK